VSRPVLARVTERTRLAVIDHVTSQTALVFPIAELVRELAARGVDVLVDGAHAPGMVDVDIAALAPAYYAANCHKWICAPKGVGFLWVREDRRRDVRPAVISHGANAPVPPERRYCDRVRLDGHRRFHARALGAGGAALPRRPAARRRRRAARAQPRARARGPPDRCRRARASRCRAPTR
jgi:selenocysteine lyase/cysteine desulfurase